MKNYRDNLEQQLLELIELQKIVERNIKKKERLTDLHVRVTSCNNNYQYYYIDRINKKSKYAAVHEINKVKEIIQHDYDIKVNDELKLLIPRLERFIDTYDIKSIDDIYSKLPKGKQLLVEPIIETDEQFIERWRELHPGSQNTYPQDGIYKTNRGERKRRAQCSPQIIYLPLFLLLKVKVVKQEFSTY